MRGEKFVRKRQFAAFYDCLPASLPPPVAAVADTLAHAAVTDATNGGGRAALRGSARSSDADDDRLVKHFVGPPSLALTLQMTGC